MSTARKKTASVFSIITILAGVIAIGLIAWRISKAWRIEYGGAPREPVAIPTGGAFGPPGGVAAEPPSAAAAPSGAPSASP